MYKYIAIRIHEGYVTWKDVPKKALKKVKAIYKELYGEDE